MREAICDTSPLQYLHQSGFLYLLAEFYAETLIPPAVVSELERGKTIGVDLPDVRALPLADANESRDWRIFADAHEHVRRISTCVNRSPQDRRRSDRCLRAPDSAGASNPSTSSFIKW